MDKPRLAVFKFTSCDGCQLSIPDMERGLVDIANTFDIAYFLGLKSRKSTGYYGISLVEGSISTPDEIKRIRAIRENTHYLVTIGACATAGGLQALRNLKDLGAFKKAVYPKPEHIDALKDSLPISHYVHVDFELWGCPISREGLLEVLASFLRERRPNIQAYSVCFECKRKGTPCVLVAQGIPCLGPITRTGCGAICPSYGRDCYGCFGPSEDPNIKSLSLRFETLGLSKDEIKLRLAGINSYAFGKYHGKE